MSSWKPNTFKNINVAPPLNVTFSGCVTPGFAFVCIYNLCMQSKMANSDKDHGQKSNPRSDDR